jgi:hypothetical protein
VVSANCRKSRAAFDGLMEWATENKAHLVCTQKTPADGGSPKRHPGYVRVSGPDDGTPCWTATYVRDGLRAAMQKGQAKSTTDIVVAGVRVFNTYWHPSQRTAGEEVQRLGTRRTLVVGDFNAKNRA